MTSALVLVRTPFQAWICERALRAEHVEDYDLLFFTQTDGPEYRFYFDALSRSARSAAYCTSARKRYAIEDHASLAWQARAWFSDFKHEIVMLGSIDNPVFSAIVARQSSALVTVDDGSANISTISGYHRDRAGFRDRVYRRLLGAPGPGELKARAVRHYTLHAGCPNIVPEDRIRVVVGFAAPEEKGDEPAVSYFIGGPFAEVLSPSQIARLTEIGRAMAVDYYVPHPRELWPLDIGVPLFDKQGRIAEDAIIRASGPRRIRLVGGFSSVLLNLSSRACAKTVILFRDTPYAPEQADLARSLGCEVMLV